jgi:hypothetical protein
MRLIPLLLLVAGCGGQAFSADLLDRSGDGAPDAVQQPEGGLPEAGDVEGGVDAAPEGETGQAEAGPVEACAPVTHSDGIGQTWQDCALLGTHDQAEAMAACQANGGTQCVANDCGGSGSSAICDVDPHSPDYCSCWVYSGPLAGHVDNTAGCTTAVQATQASCGSSASFTWQ